jgi:hypothetical protein
MSTKSRIDVIERALNELMEGLDDTDLRTMALEALDSKDADQMLSAVNELAEGLDNEELQELVDEANGLSSKQGE